MQTVMVVAHCRACGEKISGAVRAQDCSNCGLWHPKEGEWLETWLLAHRDPVGTAFSL